MVRRASKKDINAINKLGQLLNQKFCLVFDMAKILKEKFSKVYVYENENANILGFLHITELYETADILNIVVDPLHRRQKVASILIDYMLSDVGSKVSLFTLEVNCNNKAAISFYDKFDFHIINTRKAYYDHNEDAFLMAREVKQ